MDVNVYKIPERGMGTDFAKSEQPTTYSPYIRNRFLNITGAAERRLGYVSLDTGPVGGAPNLTRLHEYVAANGDITLMASTDEGTIYRYNGTAWVTAYSGLTTGNRILSIQDNDRMIFFNGVDRNIYTEDGGVTFKTVTSRIVSGKTSSTGTTTTAITDQDVTDYASLFVAANDIVYNIAKNAYGYVTSVSTATLNMSLIGTAGTGLGLAASNQAAGDGYIVIDGLANNIIPLGDGVFDNVALGGTGTNTTTVAVAGVDFSTTDIQVGDYVINTTRTALTRVLAVGTNLTVVTVTAQTSGDTFVFIKDAMPITSYAHVNWGRAYYMDASNPNIVRPSSRDDPFDLTTFSNTVNAGRVSFGNLQPLGDRLVAMTTFQRFFAAAGSRYVYVFNGTDPIQDTATSTTAFTPVAVYPQGAVSRFSLGSTGNDLLFISKDGLTNATVGSDNNSLVGGNLNEVLKNTIRRAISLVGDTDNLQLIHYPRRSWILMKIGSEIYVCNYSAVASTGGVLTKDVTWSLFTGSYCEMNHYFVRQNGDMIACGPNGGVWLMDSGYTDNGIPIPTDFTFPYLRIEDPNKSVRIKQGRYIKPNIESGGGIDYFVTAQAGLDNLSNSSVVVPSVGAGSVGVFTIGTTPIGGSGVQTQKYPLRWRGEEVKITVSTSSTNGPDVISGFTLYGEIGGMK
jgi:hypothetical protein